eukprot:31215-Pelagococcus_subviridis.AAC.3
MGEGGREGGGGGGQADQRIRDVTIGDFAARQFASRDAAIGAGSRRGRAFSRRAASLSSPVRDVRTIAVIARRTTVARRLARPPVWPNSRGRRPDEQNLRKSPISQQCAQGQSIRIGQLKGTRSNVETERVPARGRSPPSRQVPAAAEGTRPRTSTSDATTRERCAEARRPRSPRRRGARWLATRRRRARDAPARGRAGGSALAGEGRGGVRWSPRRPRSAGSSAARARSCTVTGRTIRTRRR